MVNETNQAYAYTGDDPVDESDALGLWPSLSDLNPIHDVEAGYDEVSSHFNAANGLRAVADYGAGIANFVTSTVTFGSVHVTDPFCGFGWASDVGYGYGLVGTLVLGIGELGAAEDGATATVDASETPAAETSENAQNVDDVLAELRSGRTPPNLEVDTPAQLDEVFTQLSQGGTPVDNGYPGKFVELPDGTEVGIRATSSSGGPAVDVFKADGTHITIHLP
jgi:hypothetical protein